MRFSYRDAARARAMRRRGIEENVILAFFKGIYVARDVDWLIATLRQKNNQYRKENFSRDARTFEIEAENRPPVPNEVMAKREHRMMLRPRTITALICGDPLPGESALDRLYA